MTDSAAGRLTPSATAAIARRRVSGRIIFLVDIVLFPRCVRRLWSPPVAMIGSIERINKYPDRALFPARNSHGRHENSAG
jgi:hypothetical protein